MKKILFRFFLVFMAQGLTMVFGKELRVAQFEIRTEIFPGTARWVSHAMDEAEKIKADYILIHLNTYGGMLDAADSIRTRLLNASVPVIVFIDNNAASAGALISIACNKIYMRSGSSLGAATVVNEKAEALPDKYQSYMRSMMRATAEKRGRDPRIAEAMVDPRVYIPGVNDSGRVLTFTAAEAMKNKYCEGIAESVAEVLKAEQLESADVTFIRPRWSDKIISFLMNPAVSGILILVMLGGIYFELQTPGIGFPLVAAAVAAVLYFAPFYLEGLAANWEILLVVCGFILLGLELFVIPGFGVAGISGIILIIAGFFLSMLPNLGFDFSFAGRDRIISAFSSVMISIIVSIIVMFVFGSRLLKSAPFQKLVLSDQLSSDKGFVSTAIDATPETGQRAKAVTDLRPAGKILFNDRIFNAQADTGFIEKNSDVVITGYDGIKITVRKI